MSISRRRLLAGASMMSAGAVLVPNILLAQGGADVVETTNGAVRGATIDGVQQFLGIRYGADTSGANRFMPPQPVSWSGTYDATDWAPIAPQAVNPNPSDYTKYVGWDFHRGGLSEDCLSVNIWTPAADNGNRAVMFIIHGGGFNSGSGNLVALEGQHLARMGDMVVVTVNHRLNALGYTDLSQFGGEELAASGNVGLLDLVQALQFVQDNIASFGGDPTRITITGQSGGGGKCSHLMAMPSAEGLFNGVAIQSGSTITTGLPEDRQAAAEEFVAAVGVPDGDLAKLQALPFEVLVENAGRASPVLDGEIMPRHPFEPDAPEVSANVPMIIGTTLEDWGFTISDRSEDEAEIIAWTADRLPEEHADKAEDVVSMYRERYPDKNGYLLRAVIATDSSVRRWALTQATKKVEQGAAPVWMYRWDLPAHGVGAQWGATHGADLSAAFANPTTPMHGDAEVGRLLATQLGSSFAAFAKTGDPNNSEIPEWNAYDLEERHVMVFDEETRQVADLDGDLREYWDEILGT